MFRILTVAREYGSGGGAIARKVAEQLGWELLDRKLIDAVAQAAQVDPETVQRYDERVDSWLHRIHRGGMWHAAIGAGATPNDAQLFDAETTAAIAGKVIGNAAVRSRCVIVGRGAQCTLQGCREALHVFVYAPWEQRLVRVGQRIRPGEDIEEVIRLTDQARADYVRTYFGCDWKDPHLYHMMISSEAGDEWVARIILDAVAQGG
jgi:cytidylate kinase